MSEYTLAEQIKDLQEQLKDEVLKLHLQEAMVVGLHNQIIKLSNLDKSKAVEKEPVAASETETKIENASKQKTK